MPDEEQATSLSIWRVETEDRLDELEWQASRQSSILMINISIGGLALVISGLGLASVLKMGKTLAQVVNVINGAAQSTQQVQQPANNEPVVHMEYEPARPINHGIDETRTTPTGANVATPAMGPDTELSSEERAAIENDPVAKLHRDRQDGIK